MLYKYEEDYVEQEADYSIELLKQLATIPAPSYHEENNGLKKEALMQKLIR